MERKGIIFAHQIENFVNKRTDLLIDSDYLDENGKLKASPFKFLLGHKSLILQLPVDVEEYLSLKKVKKSEIPAIKDLKDLLIQKINNFAETNKIEVRVKAEDFNNFTQNKNIIKCDAKCPFCLNKISCSYYSCWKLSNFNKHLLSCKQKATKLNQEPSLGSKAEIKRFTPAVVFKELHSALS